MTPLRQRMIEDMRMRDFSEHSISAYVSAVYRLAKHYRRSPDKLDREEIRAFLVDLVEQKQASWSYYKQILAALRFLYRHVLQRGEAFLKRAGTTIASMMGRVASQSIDAQAREPNDRRSAILP